MKFEFDSAIFKGAYSIFNLWGNYLPFEFSGPRDEYLAGRTTAWLGVCLNVISVYDVTGADANKFLNCICVNRDFGAMKTGSSKHALICNEQGKILSDGVVIKTGKDAFRTYAMAPAIQYYVEASNLDVKGEYCFDEYFFQIDGPKSLEILETACRCDLHDLKFAQNKKVKMCGNDITVHRLGMSGALAYEVHGPAKDAEVVYMRLREALEKFGGKPQGIRNYGVVNHTTAGYPNQFQHFAFPLFASGEGLAEFAKKIGAPMFRLSGSASDNEGNFFVTPYDVGWGYLVNFDHDFIGKKALTAIAKNPPRKMVTLEWNADDVADVFRSQFLGKDAEYYEPIEYHSTASDASGGFAMRGDYVLKNGKKIGVATGRTYAYYERRMISLACLDKEHALEGNEVRVQWGGPGYPVKEIRAQVARFPYYNGEYRNETFDVEKIPRQNFE